MTPRLLQMSDDDWREHLCSRQEALMRAYSYARGFYEIGEYARAALQQRYSASAWARLQDLMGW